MIRFGDQRHPLNLIIGAKALMAYAKIRYDDSSYGSKESLTVNEMVIPVDLNWNVITSEYTSMYVGVGCQYGFRHHVPLKRHTVSHGPKVTGTLTIFIILKVCSKDSIKSLHSLA